MTHSVRSGASPGFPGTSFPAIPVQNTGSARSSNDDSAADSSAAPFSDFRSVMEKQSSEEDASSSSDPRDSRDSKQPPESAPVAPARMASGSTARTAALVPNVILRSIQPKDGATPASSSQAPASPAIALTTADDASVPEVRQSVVTGPVTFFANIPQTSSQAQSKQPESFRGELETATNQAAPTAATVVSQQADASPQAYAVPQGNTVAQTVLPVNRGRLSFDRMSSSADGSFTISAYSQASAPALASASITGSDTIAPASSSASPASAPLSSTLADATSAPVCAANNEPDSVSSSNQPSPQPIDPDRRSAPPASSLPLEPIIPKQRSSTFPEQSLPQNPADLFRLNPAVLPSTAGPESPINPAQTAAAGAPVPPQNGSSSNGGPDYRDLQVDAQPAAGAPLASVPVAFEARLSPVPPAPASADAGVPPQPPPEQFTSKPSPAGPAAETTIAASPVAASAATAMVKTETAFDAGSAQTPASSLASPPSAAPIRTTTAEPGVSTADRMQTMIEAPAPLASSHQAITVKVPGPTSDTGIDLRFVERGGDIHLSVRTSSPEVAQELRGGLNDLVGRLEHAGIRTEVSNTSSAGSSLADSSKDQGESERKGSSRNPGDSQNQQQNSRGSSRSRWMEALEHSSTLSKEQTQ
jgi:hypothetical protein